MKKLFVSLILLMTLICFSCKVKNTEVLNRQLIEESKMGAINNILELLKQGANVNAVGENDGWSALMWASRNGRIEVVKLLLEKGANVNYGDKEDWTALMIAIETRNKEIVKLLLLQNANVNYRSAGGWNVLMQASRTGDIDMVNLILATGKVLINEQNSAGLTALMIAIPNMDVVKALVLAGADVKIKDKEGKTALDIAISSTSPKKNEIIDILKASGAKSRREN